MKESVPEVRKMKSVHGYAVRYSRYVNELGNNILLLFIYYKGELVENLAWCNGKELVI